MILRSALFVLALGVLSSLSASTGHNAPHQLDARQDLPATHLKKNNNKKSELQKEVEKAIEPLLVLKQHLEAHLPQRELNTIKRMAFRILLIARRYL